MTYRVGDEFWCCWVDAEDGVIGNDLWIITALRDGVAHALKKTESTWVKRSSETGDYGWASNIDAYCRAKFRVADGPAAGWARTKAAAYTKALPEVEAAIKKLTKIRAQMLGQRTKARKRRV